MRAFKWAFFNALFAASVYYGFAEDVGGARNIATFYIWLTFVISLFTGMDSVQAAMQAKGPSVAPWLDGLFDTIVAVFLLWHGEMLLATIYVIHTLLMHAMYAKPQPDPTP